MSSRRAAAQRAQASIAEQIEDSDTEDVGSSPQKPLPKSQAKGKGRGRRKSLADVAGSSSSRTLTESRSALPPKPASARRPPSGRTPRKKRARSPGASSLTDSDSDTDMTSLSSSPRSGFEPGKMTMSKDWNFNALKQDAWALVNLDGRPVDDAEYIFDRSVWWPVKITDRSPILLEAELYGDHFRDVGITIPSPSCDNIVPFLNDLQTVPFEPVPWVISPAPSLPTSPRKRRKTNHDLDAVHHAWYAAADAALRHYVKAECDDFPPPSLVSHALFKASEHIGSISDDELEVLAGPSHAKPKEDIGDYDYRIPGEGVLAQDKGYYWPARVKAMHPPKGTQRAVRFLIEYCDRTEKTVTKKQFYDQSDLEFLTCKLGQLSSGQEDRDDGTAFLHATDADRSPSPEPDDPPPDPRDFASLDLREQWVYTKTVLRAILLDEYAPTKEQNCTFHTTDAKRKKMGEQASAHGNLTPKEVERLRDYIVEWCLRDAKHATRIEDDATDEAGTNDANDGAAVDAPPQPDGLPPLSTLDEELLTPMSPAALPPPSSAVPSEPEDEQMSTDVPMDIADVSVRPPPQQGSEAYESLSPLEKHEYIMNVLLPAAIQQLLIWRSGDRRSVALQSAEEEARLYELGIKKSQEPDWVVAILQFRDFASRHHEGKAKGKSGEKGQGTPKRGEVVSDEPVLSATGRPKRQVRKGQSFRL
ncbi:hypothetical protein BD626DRAFT_572800 [Schizophyllum amplum]|uniref:PWWP domain-containing protein n=1 Tax=Schizophyllum amplum TaxID=97359 RepID=A0A550C342_9AGAR|nr:hypothetical protein BD626DRAFT_572800 [Auriculariopsis ampla]